MKKILLTLCIIVLAGCSSEYKFPEAVTEDVINENYQVVFSPSSNTWNNGGMVEDRIVFTKHISSGSGSYSEYVSRDKTLYLPTTYEFLYQGRLIGYSEHDLKFYEVKYIDNDFKIVELTPQQVEELFEGLEIKLTSSILDGEIEVSKLPWEEKTFMLLNDTPTSYYHYSFEDFDGYGHPFKSVLKVKKARKIIFSHFGANDELFPQILINVVNGF